MTSHRPFFVYDNLSIGSYFDLRNRDVFVNVIVDILVVITNSTIVIIITTIAIILIAFVGAYAVIG